MVWRESDRNCPYDGTEMIENPRRDIFGCKTCGRVLSEESLIDWDGTGKPPEALGDLDDYT
jgi:hypothetical protein